MTMVLPMNDRRNSHDVVFVACYAVFAIGLIVLSVAFGGVPIP
jgi:hypothetical protein